MEINGDRIQEETEIQTLIYALKPFQLMKEEAVGDSVKLWFRNTKGKM